MRHLALLAFLVGCTSAHPPPVPDVSAWVVADRTLSLSTSGVRCGGVAIDADLIATAEHCVPHDIVLYATRDQPDNWHSGVVISRDDVADIAIVNTALPLESWAQLGETAPGDNVYSVHHGAGHMWSMHWGTVESEPRFNGADWVLTSVEVEPGASGGGLWNSRHELTGICSWFKGSASYFAPSYELARLAR